MKFLPYILRNVMRNKLRAAFTGMSIAVSLFLVTVLYAYLNVQDENGEKSKKFARIVVTAKQGLTFPVPIAHVEKVRAMPGVKAAVPLSWFGGKYKDEKIPFGQFAGPNHGSARRVQSRRRQPRGLSARSGWLHGRLARR